MQELIRLFQRDKIHNPYFGHNIQIELINLLANKIKSKIIKKIKNTKYFSIILHCIPNASHQEQMSFILRCVDISSSPTQIVDYFLEFLKVDDTTGKRSF